MPSKLGPHFIGAPGLERWLAAGARVVKLDPSSLGASEQIPPGILVIGKLDQEDERLKLTDWKALMKRGSSPADAARDRFDAQRNIFVGPNKPRVDRYAANPRIDVWEDDNEVLPDTPTEAVWYTDYCIEMMRRYESIGKKRANFSFATGTPDIRPGQPDDIWPHLLPVVRHARDHGHYLALHEYMGPEADLSVGRRQVDVHRKRIPDAWHGRRDAQGRPDESYPYGYCPLRYRYIYDLYLRPAGLADVPLLITECGCDGVDAITPDDMESGSWKHLRDHVWPRAGRDPEAHYAEMLAWYDRRLREDPYVIGAMIFTIGSIAKSRWVDFDIAGTGVEERVLAYIAAERTTVDAPIAPPGAAVSGAATELQTAATISTTAAPAQTGIVTAPAGLNLRTRPTTAGSDESIIRVLPLGMTVDVIDREGEWYQVRTGSDEGYVFADFLAVNVAPPPGTKEKGLESALESLEAIAGSEFGVVSAPAGLNLRAQPTTAAAILSRLPQHTRIELLGPPTDGWYHVRVGAQEGYVSAEWVKPVSDPATDATVGTTGGHKPRAASVVGIHGAPGGAAPPRHLWDQWTDYMKQMGVRWYKQCEVGEDTSDNSIFRWVLHLKRNGIEPIVRYLMNSQFPHNLDGGLFRQMKRYADEGVRWAEIGNEPNLAYEWQEGWRGRYEGQWPNGRWAEEPRMRWGNPEAIDTLARVWVQDATRAADLGAWPAFYAFGPTDWGSGRPHGHYSSTIFTDRVVARLASHHRAETLRLFNERRAWIAVHVAKYEKDLDYNPYGENANKPWDMCLRGYEVVLNAFRRHFGSELALGRIPIISTEGGVFVPDHRNSVDAWRLPPNDEEHARQTVEMFRYVERHTPLTAMCPWCIAEGHGIIGHGTDLFRHHGWFKEEGGRLKERPVLEAMRRLRQEGEKSVSVAELAGGSLEVLAEPAGEQATGATITVSVQITVSGVAAKDVVVNVQPVIE